MFTIGKKEESVDSILSDFYKKIESLKSLATRKRGEVEELRIEIAQMESRQVSADEEAEKADSVAAKIESLLNL